MVKKDIKMFGFMFWLHLVLIVVAYMSPFLFSWYYVLVGVVVLVLQFLIFNFDIFNKLQFGVERDLTFYSKYLEYFGLKPNRRKLRIFMWYIMPFIILLIAIIWQLVLNIEPLFF